MSVDVEKDLHADFNNEKGAYNYSLPISVPRKGGGLWLELLEGDSVRGPVVVKKDGKGRDRFGVVHELSLGQLFRFDPHKLHMVEPWTGRRLVLVAYKSALAEKLSKHDRNVLLRYAFPNWEFDDSATWSRVWQCKDGGELETH